MPAESFRRLEEAFARAVERPHGEREEVLGTLSAELRAEVERLLVSDERCAANFSRLPEGEEPAASGRELIQGAPTAGSADPIDRLVGREAAAWMEAEGEDAWIGRQLGPWQIESRLGAGGMSTVYLARRVDGDLPMPVALKLIRPGLRSEGMLARFREERRILAGLVHPYIARLLDGGSAPDGSPYFVLERIVGEPIDRYADHHRLVLAARVDLVRRVAQAVAEAHRRLIVHRDLKPSNILVTPEGVPKLLDFGIAKLLQSEAGGGLRDDEEVSRERTGAQMRLFTPSYASPEQISGDPVTTATDVYSLGIVLYELLSGRRPFRGRATSSAEKDAPVRVNDPARLSTAVLRAVAGEGDPEEVAARRGLKVRALSRALAGDLDTIVATCLRSEPERRYASADRLAEDLDRYLAGRPIAARRDTLAYRLSKLVRRHRWAAAFALASALAISGFVLALGVQSRRLERERDASQLERRRAEAVAVFLLELFRAAPPGDESGGAVTALELADRGAAEVSRRPSGEPRVQGTLLETVGRIYLQLGLYDRARGPLEESLALRRRTLPADDPDIADSLNRLAVLSAESGAYDRAIALFRQTLAVRRRHFGPDSQQVAMSLNNLALALQDRGSYAAAAPLYRESLAIDRRLTPQGSPGLLTSRANWALLCYDLGDYAVAEAELRSVLALSGRAPDDPELAELQRYLGLVLTARGRLAEAESLLAPAESRLTATLGEEHPEAIRATVSLAELRLEQGRSVESETLFQRAFERRSRRLGVEHPETVAALAGWARAGAAAGRSQAAELRFRQALELGRRSLPPQHPDRALILAGLAELLARQKRCGEVPALARAALAIRRAAFRPEDPRLGEVARRTSGCSWRPDPD